jgi:hypothetical protein
MPVAPMAGYVEAAPAGAAAGLVPVAQTTLEDMAEGVMSGILCTYEPPDPHRLGFQRGILRGSSVSATKTFQKRQQQQYLHHRRHHPNMRRIRWKDEPLPSPQVLNWNETMERACVDASMELGCTATNTTRMDAEQAVAKARSKALASPRHGNNGLVFDDEGYVQYRDARTASSRMPLPPLPVAPPPSKKEPFLPQLCGIGLGWGEVEDEATAATTKTHSINDTTISTHSLVDEYRFQPPSPDPADLHNQRPVRRRPSRRTKKFLPAVPSPASAHAVVVPVVDEEQDSPHHTDSDDGTGPDWGSGSITSSSSLFYRVFSNKNRGHRAATASGRKKVNLKAMPIVEEITSADSGEPASVAKTIRQLEEKKKEVTKRGGEDDWDESVPVLPLDKRSARIPDATTRQQRQKATPPRRRSQSNSPKHRSGSLKSPLSSSRRRSKSPSRLRSLFPVVAATTVPPPHPNAKAPPQPQQMLYRRPRAAAAAAEREDESDKQSHIGAFREENSIVSGALPRLSRELPSSSKVNSRVSRETTTSRHNDDNSNNEWDRQSFITASRKTYAASNQKPSPPIPAVAKYTAHTDKQVMAPPPGAAVLPRDTTPPRLRRGSVSPTSGRKQRTRSRSPYRPDNAALPQQPLPMPGYYYQPPDGSLPRYFDPTNPRAFAAVSPHLQEKQGVEPPTPQPLPAESILAQQSLTSELTWEDRTRQAWDKIRNGVAALGLDSHNSNINIENNKNNKDTKTKSVDEKKPAATTVPACPSFAEYPVANDWESCPPTLMQSPSYPREQAQEHPSRRVTFGEPQKLVYYDTMDENQSERSFSSRGSTRGRKKKLKFRGTKIVEGALDRMKRSLRKGTRSRSVERKTSFESELHTKRSDFSWTDPIERDRRYAGDEDDALHPLSDDYDEYGQLYCSDYEDSPPRRIGRRNSGPLSDNN